MSTPNAEYVVVKTDGATSGKGVFVTERAALYEAMANPWIDHWNNDHVKIGKPWGGKCCHKMAVDAVLEALSVPKPETTQNDGSGAGE